MSDSPAMVTDDQLGARIDGLRKRYGERRNLLILTKADVERFEKEEKEAIRQAQETHRMSDVDQMRKWIVDTRTANVAQVDAFEAALDAVDAKLRAIGVKL